VISPPDAINDTPATGAQDVNQVIDILGNDIVSPDTQAPFAPATVKLCNPASSPVQIAPLCTLTTLTTADGTYTVNPSNGAVAFDPVPSLTGVVTVPVSYQVADTDGQIVSAIITPSVVGMPVAVDDTSSGAFNQPQTENVMADDSSNTGTPLNSNTLKLRNPSTGLFDTADVTISGEGTYSIVSGQIKFTPVLNYTGTATPVTYQVTDSLRQSVTATYTPTVNPPAGPNADPDTSTGGFNVAQSFNVVANDDSLTGTAIQASTIKLFNPAANSGAGAYVTTPVSVPQGTYSIVAGEIQFMPNNDYVGTADPVTYQIADSLGRTDTTTYTPTVPTPAGPNADPDTTSGFMGAVQSINLLTNDEASRSDVDLNVASVKLCAAGETAPACSATTVTVSGVGTYAVSNTGVMTFTPTPTYTGTPAAIPYTVEDQFGQEASSTYTPIVKSPPDALDDTPARGAHDVNQVIPVLTNDVKSPSTNAAFDPTSVKLCDPASSPAEVSPLCTATILTTVDGVYSVDPSTGVVTFDPAPSLNTVVTVPVSYQVADVDGQIVSAVITPSVVGLPTVTPDTTTGPFNQAQSKAVLLNDTPGDGTSFISSTLKLRDPSTSTLGTSPVTIDYVGTYSISGSNIVFTPVNGYAGTPTPVTYQITDNFGASASTTYTPTIQPPAGPVATPDTSSGALNTAQLKTVVTNDTSSTGTAIAASSVKLFDPTANSGAGAFVTTPVTLVDGVYSIVSGQVRFMPNTDFVGTAAPVTYQIEDSLGQLATTTYTPTVVMPSGPTASPDTTSGFKGVPQSINLTTNDSAAAGVTLNVASVKLCTGSETAPNCSATTVTVANVGTYVVASTGVITFTPTANFTGTPAALPYIVKDQFNQVASSTYTPTVQTPPDAVDDTPAVGLNDVNQVIDVLANDVKSTSTNAVFVPATVKLCAGQPGSTEL
jgi:CshA-type fibril repeat protein